MNRLGSETSPYLRQHKDNPVDWYPWGDEAFATAKDRDRPILLSVGYSACHWCHVMAHESFEDPATATVMNELFVNVKVDREERPDVDAIYMDAVLTFTGSGGWPMTVFLTPDGRPFFGGTYFPPRSSHGRPGFVDLLARVDEAWREQRGDLDGQASEIAERIRLRSAVPPGDGELGADVLSSAYSLLRDTFDRQWGGFGHAPKFPMPSNLELLLRAYASNGSAETLGIVTTTLDAMASGGIYDHLGGGFARYSVDREWLVPHFEKMLYDNAGLAAVYLHAFQLTGEARFRQVVEETIGYVMRDLRQPEGGISSAEDADSEGIEGKFYVWSIEEVRQIAPEAVEWYGVTAGGNFEGTNILTRPARGDLARSPDVEAARQRLFDVRHERVRPGLDDKVLTEWNAMFLATLAEAGAALDRSDWIAVAVVLGEFLVGSLRRDDGRWMRSWQRDGGARHLAYAVDYAWLVDGFVRLGEATGEARWIAEARAAADGLLALFADADAGGFFTTGHDAEALIVRQKDLYDGATPAANSVATVALLRLGALTGERRYTEAAEGVLRLISGDARTRPTAYSHALGGLDMVLTGATEIAVVGDRPDLVRVAAERYLPNAVLAWGEPYESPLWEGRDAGQAYVCRQFACQRPATTAADLAAQLP